MMTGCAYSRVRFGQFEVNRGSMDGLIDSQHKRVEGSGISDSALNQVGGGPSVERGHSRYLNACRAAGAGKIRFRGT